uniref:Uncharacterized protein n=1 Tax=Anguilla anguilla TaxID=7936 RepID=A0A0E9UCY8_ANGAN
MSQKQTTCTNLHLTKKVHCYGLILAPQCYA